jgi:pimeloyl-ACP methyl ester carboxylesterase
MELTPIRARLATLDPANVASCISLGKIVQQCYDFPAGPFPADQVLADYPDFTDFHFQRQNGNVPAWYVFTTRRTTYVCLGGITTPDDANWVFQNSALVRMNNPACRVHGAIKIYGDQVIQFLQVENKIHLPNIVLFGHSLGGAAAQYIAAVLKNTTAPDANYHVNSAGATKVGDEQFASLDPLSEMQRWESRWDLYTSLWPNDAELEAWSGIPLLGILSRSAQIYYGWDQYRRAGVGRVFSFNNLTDLDHTVWEGLEDYLSYVGFAGLSEYNIYQHALTTYIAAWEAMLPIVVDSIAEAVTGERFYKTFNGHGYDVGQDLNQVFDDLHSNPNANPGVVMAEMNWPNPDDLARGADQTPVGPDGILPTQPALLVGGFQPDGRYPMLDRRYVVRVVKLANKTYGCKWVKQIISVGPSRGACRHYAARMNQALSAMHNFRSFNASNLQGSLSAFLQVSPSFLPPVNVQ